MLGIDEQAGGEVTLVTAVIQEVIHSGNVQFGDIRRTGTSPNIDGGSGLFV